MEFLIAPVSSNVTFSTKSQWCFFLFPFFFSLTIMLSIAIVLIIFTITVVVTIFLLLKIQTIDDRAKIR